MQCFALHDRLSVEKIQFSNDRCIGCLTFANGQEALEAYEKQPHHGNQAENRDDEGPAEQGAGENDQCFHNGDLQCLPDMELGIFGGTGHQQRDDDANDIQQIYTHAGQLAVADILSNVLTGVVIIGGDRNRGQLGLNGLNGYFLLKVFHIRLDKCVQGCTADGTEQGLILGLMMAVGTVFHRNYLLWIWIHYTDRKIYCQRCSKRLKIIFRKSDCSGACIITDGLI